MSSILNILNSQDDGLNLVILVPLFTVVVVAIGLLLKFSMSKPEVKKKSQNNAKKQQKSQTAINSKQKDERINSEKKEKISKEKKLSSPNKSVDKQAGNEAAKVSKKPQSAVDEKASKKNSAQTKKHQENNNVNNKNNVPTTKNNQTSNKKQKTVDIFINKEEEGEWQMVTTKKQKQTKQEEKAEIATTPTKASKKSQKSIEKANKQPSNKTKKSKDNAEKSDNATKLVNSEAITPDENQTVNTFPKENTEKINENDFIHEVETAKVDFNSNNTNITSVNNNQEVIAKEAPLIANVAFDELGDDGWTDTKPQKKNRKRALRE